MQHRSVVAGLAVPLGLVLVGACSSGSHNPTTPATTAAPATSAAPPGLPGTYLAEFTSGDQFGPPGHTITFGDWVLGGPSQGSATLTISPTQMVLTSQGDTRDVMSSTITYTSDHFIVGASVGDPCPHLYPATPMTGTYIYTLTGHTLVVHEVSDSCLERAGALTLRSWNKE